jgi:hypothetical protein
MKKTISIITLGGILMLFVYACSADFLDTKPANVISTAGVWDNAELAVQVVNGVYNALRADYATNSGYDGELHFYDYRNRRIFLRADRCVVDHSGRRLA